MVDGMRAARLGEVEMPVTRDARGRGRRIRREEEDPSRAGGRREIGARLGGRSQACCHARDVDWTACARVDHGRIAGRGRGCARRMASAPIPPLVLVRRCRLDRRLALVLDRFARVRDGSRRLSGRVLGHHVRRAPLVLRQVAAVVEHRVEGALLGRRCRAGRSRVQLLLERLQASLRQARDEREKGGGGGGRRQGRKSDQPNPLAAAAGADGVVPPLTMDAWCFLSASLFSACRSLSVFCWPEEAEGSTSFGMRLFDLFFAAAFCSYTRVPRMTRRFAAAARQARAREHQQEASEGEGSISTPSSATGTMPRRQSNLNTRDRPASSLSASPAATRSSGG